MYCTLTCRQCVAPGERMSQSSLLAKITAIVNAKRCLEFLTDFLEMCVH